jgi:hypothetical protein
MSENDSSNLNGRNWQFYDSLREYVASFFVDPKAILQVWPEEQTMNDQAPTGCLAG